jgi:phasin family protein
MEQLAALNLAASREFFNAGVANTQQLLNAKDPKELAKLNSALAQPSVEKLVEYSRSVCDLAANVQKEITSVIEAQYSSFAKNATSVIEKGSAAAPVGGDVFAAAMKQILQASTKTYENMTAMAKQMTDIAEANVKTATSATAKAAAAAKKK